MAISDSKNIFARLKKYTVDWFGTDSPLLDCIYDGFAAGFSYINDLIVYVKKQLRIKTATDTNLDLISQDFFGGLLPRNKGESDERYRSRILINLLRERATREGMRKIIFFLTGINPIIIEPWRGADCGYYNVPSKLAYDTVGRYGSNNFPYQAFIIVFRKLVNGAARFGAYNQVYWGYNVIPPPKMRVKNGYVSDSMWDSYVTAHDIYFAVRTTRMNSTKIWVKIVDLEVA